MPYPPITFAIDLFTQPFIAKDKNPSNSGDSNMSVPNLG
jgi:hypothetical protein